MPAPRSRRPTRMNPRQDPPPAADDGIEVDEPVVDEYAAQTVELNDGATDDADQLDAEADPDQDVPANAKRSGRGSARGSARASKRMSASERRSAARKSMKSSRREATPEQRAKRRAAQLLVVKILGGVIIGMGVIFAVWWFLLRVDEKELLARQNLAQAQTLARGIETAISVRDPVAAETKRTQAIEYLEIAELGFAKANFDPEDPLLASPVLANQAVTLRDRLDAELKARVEQIERDVRVERNLRTVQSGFGRLTGANAYDDAELVVFEQQVQGFLDNPYVPGAGANAAYQEEYADEIRAIKFEVIKIDREKNRREAAITNVPVREARARAAILVKQARFQEALATVDEMQRTYQSADFAGVRQYIRDAARLAWDSTAAVAEEHWKTWQAPGTTPALAETSKKAARDLMQSVVDTYGIPEYVSKAQDALSRYR